MTTFGKGVGPGPIELARAVRRSGKTLTIAALMLAAAAISQPGVSYAQDFGGIANMLMNHHFRGAPSHNGRNRHHSQSRRSSRSHEARTNETRSNDEAGPTRSAAKSSEGPNFTPAR